jgi:ankyrin repeat protein
VLIYIPGLVTQGSYDDGDSEIKLAHFSIKEYLVSEATANKPPEPFLFTEQDAHLHIAESCLAYHSRLSEAKLATKDSFSRFKLWDYVANYWIDHLENVTRASWSLPIINRLTQFSTYPTRALFDLVRIGYKFHNNIWELKIEESPTPLYYSAENGALKLAGFQIDGSASVDEVSPVTRFFEGGTPLQAALIAKKEGMVQFLLSKGADANVRRERCYSPLLVAVSEGNSNIVQLLLNSGANANYEVGGTTPLTSAANKCYYHIVQLLLENGAEINRSSGAALISAVLADTARLSSQYSSQVHESIVELLIRSGADINLQGGYFHTALQAAAFLGNQRIVGLLIQSGADCNVQGGIHGSTLIAAVRNGNKNIVQLLLESGANINARGGGNKTALHVAANFGLDSIVKLLLEKGADMYPPVDVFGTILQQVVYQRSKSESMVETLLGSGVDPNVRGGIYGNALQAAIAGGSRSTAKLLLSRGSEVFPPGVEWEALLKGVIEHSPWEQGPLEVKRLREFQSDPWGYVLSPEPH